MTDTRGRQHLIRKKTGRRVIAIMCRIFWSLLAGAVILYPLFAEQEARNRLQGVVSEENGAPIAGAKIFAWRDATSDAQGKFELENLPSQDSVIYFQKEGFRPKASVLKAGASSLVAVLEDDAKSAWVMPGCKRTDAGTSPVGQQLKFLLPKNSQVRKVKDIDYQEYLVAFAKDAPQLQLWWGPMVTSGKAVNDLILQSASFELRSIHRDSGETVGYDQWGKTVDGKMWRSADFPGFSGAAVYEGVSIEAAKAYNQIIDSACQLSKVR